MCSANLWKHSPPPPQIGHANRGGGGLCFHKLAEIIKLAANTRIARVVHEYEKLKSGLIALEGCPFSDRHAVLAVKSANIFLIDSWDFFTVLGFYGSHNSYRHRVGSLADHPSIFHKTNNT